MLKRILFGLIVVLLARTLEAADRPPSRVLFIGIDGCRTDTLKTAKTPTLHALMKDGAYSEATNILGSRGDTADTCSGPGWSNLLTGVWPDKHGVLDNGFKVRHYDTYPHFFTRVKEAYPQAKTYSYSTWEPIQKFIVSSADESLHFASKKEAGGLGQADSLAVQRAIEVMHNGDPDVMFVYADSVDHAGHTKGFHPTVPEYRAALEQVDKNIGELIAAMHERPNYKQENWLVLVGTDHGGRGTGHGKGRAVPEINTVFLIVSGGDAARGEIAGKTNQVDLAATALTHLGIPLNPEWKLDGKPVGLKTAEPAATGRQ